MVGTGAIVSTTLCGRRDSLQPLSQATQAPGFPPLGRRHPTAAPLLNRSILPRFSVAMALSDFVFYNFVSAAVSVEKATCCEVVAETFDLGHDDERTN